MKKLDRLRKFLTLLLYRLDTKSIVLSKKVLNKYYIDEYTYDQEFVKLLLSKYYHRLKNIFKSKEKFIYIQLSDGEYIILDSLANFIRKSESSVTGGFLSAKEIKHFHYLKSLVDYNKAEEQITDETLEYYYQEQYHKIANSKMVSILSLEPQKFKNMLWKKSNNDLDDELIVALITFINKYINANYYLYPEYMASNINDGLNAVQIDVAGCDDYMIDGKNESLREVTVDGTNDVGVHTENIAVDDAGVTDNEFAVKLDVTLEFAVETEVSTCSDVTFDDGTAGDDVD